MYDNSINSSSKFNKNCDDVIMYNKRVFNLNSVNKHFENLDKKINNYNFVNVNKSSDDNNINISKITRLYKDSMGKKQKKSGKLLLTIENKNNQNISYDKMKGRPSLCIVLIGFNVDCLLDTGASVNVIDRAVIDKIEHVQIKSTTDQLQCANKSKLKIIGKTSLWTEIDDKGEWIEFTVVEEMSPSVIGGMNLLWKFGIMLNKVKEEKNIEIESNICEIIAKFGREITDEERFYKAIEILKMERGSELYKLIDQNKCIFMADDWDIGKTMVLKHCIKTTGGPIHIRPRRQSVNLEQKIENAIQNL